MYVWGKKGIDWDTVEVCICLKGGEMGCTYIHANGKTRGEGRERRGRGAKIASTCCNLTSVYNQGDLRPMPA